MGIRILLFFFCLSMVAGCSSTFSVVQWSGSGFLKRDFWEYQTIAILPFEGDDSGEVLDVFTQGFHAKFPQIAIVDRRAVAKALWDHRLTHGQLDEGVRAQMGKTVGAQALITGSIHYPTVLRWFFQVVIVDIETGRVMGRSVAEINFMGASGQAEGARLAVEKLAIR